MLVLSKKVLSGQLGEKNLSKAINNNKRNRLFKKMNCRKCPPSWSRRKKRVSAVGGQGFVTSFEVPRIKTVRKSEYRINVTG